MDAWLVFQFRFSDTLRAVGNLGAKALRELPRKSSWVFHLVGVVYFVLEAMDLEVAVEGQITKGERGERCLWNVLEIFSTP